MWTYLGLGKLPPHYTPILNSVTIIKYFLFLNFRVNGTLSMSSVSRFVHCLDFNKKSDHKRLLKLKQN